MTREFTTIRTVNEYDDNDTSLSTIHIYVPASRWHPLKTVPWPRVRSVAPPLLLHAVDQIIFVQADTRWAGWSTRFMTLHKDHKIILIY